MHLDRGAVQRHRFNSNPYDLSMLQALEHPIKHARLRPAAHASIDGMLAPKALGQRAPLAALLGDVQDGVEHLKIGQTDIAALHRQAVLNKVVLGFCDFHDRSISCINRSVNRP